MSAVIAQRPLVNARCDTVLKNVSAKFHKRPTPLQLARARLALVRCNRPIRIGNDRRAQQPSKRSSTNSDSNESQRTRPLSPTPLRAHSPIRTEHRTNTHSTFSPSVGQREKTKSVCYNPLTSFCFVLCVCRNRISFAYSESPHQTTLPARLAHRHNHSTSRSPPTTIAISAKAAHGNTSGRHELNLDFFLQISHLNMKLYMQRCCFLAGARRRLRSRCLAATTNLNLARPNHKVTSGQRQLNFDLIIQISLSNMNHI